MIITSEIFDRIMSLTKASYMAGVKDGREDDYKGLDCLALYEKSSAKEGADNLIKNKRVFVDE